MYWHLALEAAAVLLFTAIAWRRWRQAPVGPSAVLRLSSFIAVGLLIFASALGGHIVYHGGAGISRGVFTAYEQEQEEHHHATNHSHGHHGGPEMPVRSE